MTRYKLDITSIVTFLGGPRRIEADMRAAGLPDPISFKTVQKWRERDSLPAQRLVDLMALAEWQGRRLDIRNHLKRRLF